MVACMTIDAFEAHEASVSRLRFGGGVYLTKRPGDLAAIGPRLRLDPHFHAICLMRDPRDVVVSRHAKDQRRYWTPLRIWKARVPIARDLSRHARFTMVRYEDLVHDPDGTGQRLAVRLPFLGLRHPFSAFPAVASPAESAIEALGGLRPFDVESIGNWRRHLPRVAGQLALYGSIADELIEFGYEADNAWLSELRDVAPDLSSSHRGGAGRRWRRYIERSIVPRISARAVVAGRAVGLPVA
jgi:hypothetical protein